jgi:hypothetical protein
LSSGYLIWKCKRTYEYKKDTQGYLKHYCDRIEEKNMSIAIVHIKILMLGLLVVMFPDRIAKNYPIQSIGGGY